MENQLISFKTAVLAKEKGFDKLTHSYYFEDGEFREFALAGTNGYYGEEYKIELEEFYENWNSSWLIKKNNDRCFGCIKSKDYFETFSAPTQSLLQKWLREIHNLNIVISDTHHGIEIRYNFSVKELGLADSNPAKRYIVLGAFGVFKNYEDCLEKALQEALKLIK